MFITHDLDEAIRIGDRIAIMKDGVLVQIGTPEEIVTNPVDEYVAQFVGGISKLDLVTAAKVMLPLEQYRQTNGSADTANWPVARPDDKLNTLVNLSIGTDHPILVQRRRRGCRCRDQGRFAAGHSRPGPRRPG